MTAIWGRDARDDDLWLGKQPANNEVVWPRLKDLLGILSWLALVILIGWGCSSLGWFKPEPGTYATENQCINALVRARQEAWSWFSPIYSKVCVELEAGGWDFGE